MSLYNMLNGYTTATFFILPLLGKHPNEYPRFRDCFTRDEERPEFDNHIHIYTRTGGGNREAFQEENEAIRAMDGFVTDFDDSFDSTFASWIFEVPKQFKADFALILDGKHGQVSQAYIDKIGKVFPDLKKNTEEYY